jgi:hypothetical protein
MERASGNALQAWTKGPYDTIATLSSGLLSPKNPALSQRLAVIVIKVDRQEQQKPFLAPVLAPKTFCEHLRFRGQALWRSRPTFLAKHMALVPLLALTPTLSTCYAFVRQSVQVSNREEVWARYVRE